MAGTILDVFRQHGISEPDAWIRNERKSREPSTVTMLWYYLFECMSNNQRLGARTMFALFKFGIRVSSESYIDNSRIPLVSKNLLSFLGNDAVMFRVEDYNVLLVHPNDIDLERSVSLDLSYAWDETSEDESDHFVACTYPGKCRAFSALRTSWIKEPERAKWQGARNFLCDEVEQALYFAGRTAKK